MNRISTLFLFSIALISACGGKQDQKGQQQSSQKEMLAEVMKIHDEVMPEMQTIHNLTKKLQTKIDSLENTSGEPEEIAKLIKYNNELKTAEKAMMDWMHTSEFEFGDMPHDSVMMILEEEKTEINFVRSKMMQSIDSAEAAL